MKIGIIGLICSTLALVLIFITPNILNIIEPSRTLGEMIIDTKNEFENLLDSEEIIDSIITSGARKSSKYRYWSTFFELASYLLLGIGFILAIISIAKKEKKFLESELV